MLVDESATVDILCRTSRMEREGDKDLWPRLGMLSQLNNVYKNPQLPIEQLSENPQLPIEQRFWQAAASNWTTFTKIRSSQLNNVSDNPQLPIEQRFWQSAAVPIPRLSAYISLHTLTPLSEYPK